METYKLQLKPLNGKDYYVTEMLVISRSNSIGEIIRVDEPILQTEYEGLKIWLSSCKVGEIPVLVSALGIPNFKLDCTITAIIPMKDKSEQLIK